MMFTNKYVIKDNKILIRNVDYGYSNLFRARLTDLGRIVLHCE